MAVYNEGGGQVSVVLTKEGAARANELHENGIEVKVTKMRVYRTPTLAQNLPHVLTGEETRATVNSWSCFPNHETTFPVIENFPEVPMSGYLLLLGVLGADVGTFSYDAVALFLEDDTLYAIGVTSRLLTKRKASIGTTSNIQELSFNIAHKTVDELATFSIEDVTVDYTKIDEVQYPHLLPKKYNKSKRIFRLTNGGLQTYTQSSGFDSSLVSQIPKVSGSKTYGMWIFHDYIRLFDRKKLQATITKEGKVKISIPLSSFYPSELLTAQRDFILSLDDPNSTVQYPALKLRLEANISDSLGYHFTFNIRDVSYTASSDLTLAAQLFVKHDDGIYQDAIQAAMSRMATVEYSAGRQFATDNLNVNPSSVLEPFWKRSSNWTKLDSTINVSTSVYEASLATPGLPQPIPFVAGGTKHVPIRATYVWINTENGLLSPTISIDKSTITDGEIAKVTIKVAGAKEGTKVAWSMTYSFSNNFLITPKNKVGYVTLDSNGVGTFDISPEWGAFDNTLIANISLIGYADQRVILAMVSNALNVWYSSDSAGNNRITESDEGKTVYLQIRTARTSSIDFPAYLFLDEVNVDDIDGTLPASVTVVNGSATLAIGIKADQLTEGEENLRIWVSKSSDFARAKTEILLKINDTSTTPLSNYDVYMATNPDGSGRITSITNLGAAVYLIVTGTNVPPNEELIVDFSGTFLPATDANPPLPDPLQLTLINGFASYPIYTVNTGSSGNDGDIVFRELRINENRMDTYNVYSTYLATFGTPTANTGLKVYVADGVTVVGSNTDSPAIDFTGYWPTSFPIILENGVGSKIMGRGGNGGYVNDSEVVVAGTNGGAALKTNSPVTVNNRGIIGGGGGGSGAAYNIVYLSGGQSGITYFALRGGCGGRPLGGAGNNSATAFRRSGYSVADQYSSNGNAGTLSDPGYLARMQANEQDWISELRGGELGAKGTDAYDSTSGGAWSSSGGNSGPLSIGQFTINNIGIDAHTYGVKS